MDHAINALLPYYEVELDMLTEELSSGNYKKLTECPSYASAKVLLDAIHSIERYYYGKVKTESIREEMRWRGV